MKLPALLHHALFTFPQTRNGIPSAKAFFSVRGIRFAPTRYGALYFAMLAALLLGSVNHNSNLGYIITFLLNGMALVSLFHSWRNISDISAAAVRARPVFALQSAFFDIQLRSERRDHPGLSLSFPGGVPTETNLCRDTQQMVQVALHAPKRGLLRPGVLIIATDYPLGLFLVWRSIPVFSTCLVYPAPAAGPLMPVPGPDEKNSEGDAGGRGVDDFSGLETYQPGDPLQHISWKAYSRGQGLHTKKFEGWQGKSMYFSPDALAGTDFELKLSRICHMIITAEAMRIAYGLRLGELVIRPATGEKHKRQCLRELALTRRWS
jgi:uncharacterized protein (DUF58 family)